VEKEVAEAEIATKAKLAEDKKIILISI